MAGLIQLGSIGNQGKYFTDNPQITFFKSTMPEYQNFYRDTKICPFSSTPNFGNRVTCQIDKSCDLLHQLYLHVTLPRINSKEYLFSWIRKIGYVLIKNIEIQIGDKVIDRQCGDWMNIWNGLQNPKNIDKMIGNIDELICPSKEKNEYVLIIPLTFWFCNKTYDCLPVCALKESVNINVDFNDLENCCNCGDLNLNLGDTYILTHCTMLDEADRAKIVGMNHQILIEQILTDGEKKVNYGNNLAYVPFKRSCKELLWRFSVKDLCYLDVASTESILLGGKEIVIKRDSGYFNMIQIYQNHSSYIENVNLYSFGLYEDFVSGAVNLSTFGNVAIKFNINKSCENIKFVSYLRCVNIMTIIDGCVDLVV